MRPLQHSLRGILAPALAAGLVVTALSVQAAESPSSKQPDPSQAIKSERDDSELWEQKRKVDLSLPPERAARIKLLQSRTDEEMAKLKMRMGALTQELEQQYLAYRFDEQRCRRLHQEIQETQNQLLERQLRFQLDVRAELAEPEFAMLRKKFRDAKKWKPLDEGGKFGKEGLLKKPTRKKELLKEKPQKEELLKKPPSKEQLRKEELLKQPPSKEGA